MNAPNPKTGLILLATAMVALSFTGCLTPQKFDKFVSAQYNDQLPAVKKRKGQEIEVASAAESKHEHISTTVNKTDVFLPLIVYWQYKHRLLCSLNPAIPATQFTNAVNAQASKALVEKLQGRKLELKVEEAPSAFSFVANEHAIWVIYAISWTRIYIEPDHKDLVVSYRLMDGATPVKVGSITVKNTERDKNLRFLQSWKSATSEYISTYNNNMNSMVKTFVGELTNQL